uniref:Uncharacterized protein n=1 Tax=Rousettus aegyptiacus TaxID=9407 RepID=A0A7J8DXJ4_ROUAE|nr:hypothetical protein HJG63_008274 [Rousettus aegyptiacus]
MSRARRESTEDRGPVWDLRSVVQHDLDENLASTSHRPGVPSVLAPAFPRPGGTLGSASPAGRPGGPSSSWRARRAGPGKASLWTCTLSRHARQRPARKPDTQSQRSLCHRKQVKTQRRPAKQPQTVGLSPGQRGGQPGSGRSTGHPRGLCRECTSRHPASAPRSREGLRAERAGQGQTPAAGQPPRAQLLVL